MLSSLFEVLNMEFLFGFGGVLGLFIAFSGVALAGYFTWKGAQYHSIAIFLSIAFYLVAFGSIAIGVGGYLALNQDLGIGYGVIAGGLLLILVGLIRNISSSSILFGTWITLIQSAICVAVLLIIMYRMLPTQGNRVWLTPLVASLSSH